MKHGSPLSPMNWPTPLQAYWCSTRCTPWKCTNKREARNIWEEATSSLHWHPIASPSSLISSYCWCFSVPYALYAFSNFLSGWHWDSTYFASPSKPTLDRHKAKRKDDFLFLHLHVVVIQCFHHTICSKIWHLPGSHLSVPGYVDKSVSTILAS